ncbi:DUF3825 domain-containing protein [Anaerotignum sp. MB30-C6]|uniref:DUF3825 domain-containing protein n=1 Tax=Anaerotignum sp. MB30-C6 TaxID=3070814 RepID=UPI0027DEA489|nr:DUF3825 domain-containing protein [Anaerotignum sp. MB30-C6]WMI81787.1 DUF3825 domain-containing protein [Anaerotignum sp. MB30-C6]
MKMKWNSERSGVYALGYVQNANTYLSDISHLIQTEVTEKALCDNLKEAYDEDRVINFYYDNYGNLQTGEFDEKRTCRYAIETGFEMPNMNPAYPPDPVYAVFIKDGYGTWSGVNFSTKYKMENMFNAYRFGSISFKNYNAANSFIISLEENLLPGEVWNFKSSVPDDFRPKTQFDILQSYLQYVFEKLVSDYTNPESKNYKKIVFSIDHKYALFNTGLLNKFAQDIYLVGEVYNRKDNKFIFSSPFIAPSKVDLMRKYQFASASLYPNVVEFFHSLDDIIYDSEIEIDISADKLTHIIEDGAKRNRFSEKYTQMYKQGELPAITSILIAAIDNARKIAKRNYKFVVPQYRSERRGEPGKIQFLMPIYLDRQYGEKPDFALVLNTEIMPDKTKIYTPETILELSWAYNNARVICKPEDTWLNPTTIDRSPMDGDESEDTL